MKEHADQCREPSVSEHLSMNLYVYTFWNYLIAVEGFVDSSRDHRFRMLSISTAARDP